MANLTPRQWAAVALFALIVSSLLTPLLVRHLITRNRRLAGGAA